MSEPRHYYLVTPLAYTGASTAFTYHSNAPLTLGQIVHVPLGRRHSLGVITALVPDQPDFTTKSITRALDLPPVPTYLLQLATWMSDYYAASPSAVWSTFLPAGLTKTRRAPKSPSTITPAQGLPSTTLTAEQAATLQAIRASARPIHLVQGVTGSGKTRLYLELTTETLAAGRSAVILVPEITLTPQIVGQFEAAFGAHVLTTHSKLTEAQRDHIWRAATAATQRQEPCIVVGPRSSLFLPLHQPGLLIVDESHETSYKQEQHPRYHALTVAAKLGQLTSARVVFGSATPSLQELFLARSGRIEHHLLTHRVNKLPHSQAQIIDLRRKEDLKLSKFIAQPLINAITASLAAERQSLLYLNRRGSASSQVCGDCGYVSTCPNCLLPLTFHADLLRLLCHHCNYRRVSPAVCPDCNGIDLKLLGGGTKRIEAEVERLWPHARIARVDRDSATLSHIKTVYAGLKAGTIDIVIGTQMIAKGLDLPAIDTVGVINADTLLHVPDFSAAERTFQLLTQVSGRAGRGDRPGQIFIQTHTPNHPSITAAAASDFEQFSLTELANRQALHYPPYVYLLKLTVTCPTRTDAQAQAQALADHLRARTDAQVVGPAPAFIETQAGTYRWVLTVRAHRRSLLVAIARSLPGDHWIADLDPLNLL